MKRNIDISILKHLSSLYPSLELISRELVSNAFDADAKNVEIILSIENNFLIVKDDGCGMSPKEITELYLRLGAKPLINNGKFTKEGRIRIGRKGIGFIAGWNYCESITLRTSTEQIIKENKKIKIGKRGILLNKLLRFPIQPKLVRDRFNNIKVNEVPIRKSKVVNLHNQNGELRLTASKLDYYFISYEFDLSGLETICNIDTKNIQSTSNINNWQEWGDCVSFSEINKSKLNDASNGQYTIIELKNMRNLIKDLQLSQRKNYKVRKNGLDRLIWNLSRILPIEYEEPIVIERTSNKIINLFNEIQSIPKVTIQIENQSPILLQRPVWSNSNSNENTKDGEIIKHININKEDIQIIGYIYGSLEIINPAEYRGLSFRLQNVLVGNPSFLEYDKKILKKRRWVLKHITGEILILNGIDPLDGLSPGRDKFNTETHGYQVLVRELFGNDNDEKGLVDEIIEEIEYRKLVKRQVLTLISKISSIRDSLLEISAAINNYGTDNEWVISSNKQTELDNNRQYPLNKTNNLPSEFPQRIGTYMVIKNKSCQQNFKINYSKKEVEINPNQDIWHRNIFILGRHFDVIFKQGTVKHPLCEIDFNNEKIYLNWTHPLRVKLGPTNFIRSSIGMKIAQIVEPNNADESLKIGLEFINYKDF